jgi:hypothetical protein
MFNDTRVVVWFHREEYRSVQFLFRPCYQKKVELPFADMLTSLRRLIDEEKTADLLLDETGPETRIARLNELLGRTGE